MATILTTAEVAASLNTDPRTLRKFLRSNDSGIESVGKGKRYSITAAQVRSLRSKFTKWETAAAEAKAAREAAADAEAATEVIEVDDDALDAADALEDPSDDDIEALETDDDEN